MGILPSSLASVVAESPHGLHLPANPLPPGASPCARNSSSDAPFIIQPRMPPFRSTPRLPPRLVVGAHCKCLFRNGPPQPHPVIFQSFPLILTNTIASPGSPGCASPPTNSTFLPCLSPVPVPHPPVCQPPCHLQGASAGTFRPSTFPCPPSPTNVHPPAILLRAFASAFAAGPLLCWRPCPPPAGAAVAFQPLGQQTIHLV